MESLRKLGGMTQVCDGTGSHFGLERSLVIFVLWSSSLARLCNKFGQNSCILVVSHPVLCVDQHFQIWPRLASGHVIPFYGGVSKSSHSPCILTTRSMKAVT